MQRAKLTVGLTVPSWLVAGASVQRAAQAKQIDATNIGAVAIGVPAAEAS
ncbi:MAG TPA: hypothetical protein P5024_10820 [Burkholderiaceae bacterium]|nr:hypothetical protein [Burkholderiaceae bacterium]